MGKIGILISVVLLALASCSAPLGVQQLVPQDAMAVFQVEQPKKYLEDLELFLKPLGVTNGKSLMDLIKDNENLLGFRWEALDLDQPWAAALVKGAENKPGVLLVIPLKDPSKNFPLLKEALEKKGGQKSLLQGSYAVIYSGLEKEPVYPLQKGFDTTKLKVGEKAGLVSYLDLKALEAALFPPGFNWDDLFTKVLTQDLPSVSPQRTTYETLARNMSKVFQELSEVQANVVTDAKGLAVWSRVGVKPAGEIQTLLKGMETVKGSREFYKYLDSGALLSAVVNLPEGKLAQISQKLTQLAFTGLPVGEEVTKAYLQQLSALNELQGPRSAFNFNLDYNPQQLFMAFFMGIPNADQLKSAVTFDLNGVSELRDPAAYQNALKSFFASPALGKIFEQVFKSSGLSIRLKPDYTENTSDKSFSYSSLVFRAELTEGVPSGQRANAVRSIQMFNAVLEQFRGYYMVKNQKCYFAFGSGGLIKLKSLVEKDSAEHNWTTEESLKPWAEMLPDDSALTANLSLHRISALVRKSSLPGTDMVPEVPAALGPLGYIRVLSDGRMESGFFWNENELQVLTNHIMAILPRLMGQGAGTGDVQ